MLIEERYFIENNQEKQDLISLAPSSKFILYVLKQRGPLSRNEILDKTLLPKRTVAYALQNLIEKNFIKRSKHEKDKRVSIFESII
jgi:DNA-binding MarR family transcriptional regulator